MSYLDPMFMFINAVKYAISQATSKEILRKCLLNL